MTSQNSNLSSHYRKIEKPARSLIEFSLSSLGARKLGQVTAHRVDLEVASTNALRFDRSGDTGEMLVSGSYMSVRSTPFITTGNSPQFFYE